MKIRSFIFSILAALPIVVNAQSAVQYNSAEIKLKLQKLNTLGSALYIAAHPDDENTRLLGYLANEKNVRTGYLSLTRGDGGQNLIGNEQAELLGLIRTQELLAARRVDGAEQFFTRAVDFGFSKTSDETFKIWGKNQILADAVWVIRKFRPDVIITRFPEDARAGHGHHAASAIIAREAFVAAADPKMFPEQLKYVQIWQAKRIVWNTFNFGGNNNTAISEDQFKLDVGAYNALLGKSYGEIAAESRSKHKSQGFGSAKQRGQSYEYFSPVGGQTSKTDLFDGVDLSWNRTNTATIQKLVNEANQNYNQINPSASVPILIKTLSEIEKMKDGFWKEQKEKEVKNLILACAGLWFETYADEPNYAIGDSLKTHTQFVLRSSIPVSVNSVNNLKKDSTLNNTLKTIDSKVLATKSSQPYWLAEKHLTGQYLINDQLLVGNAENVNSLKVQVQLSIAGKVLTFDSPVIYKYTDPVNGEIYQPLAIAPPITATLSEKAYAFAGSSTKTIHVYLRSFRDNSSGKLIPQVPPGWVVSPKSIDIKFAKKGDEQTADFLVTPFGNVSSGNISLLISDEGKTYNEGLKIVSYNHIPLQTLFPQAEARAEKIDLKISGKRIAYIPGAGDLVPEALKQVGYDVTILSENQAANFDLSGYDAIITGIRTYNVNDRMKFLQPKLLKYVENGGTLLVQYNVNNGLKLQDIGPYPFKLSRNRVTEEDAKVTFLAPNHQVLNFPNKIAEADFTGWIQERGLYFVTDADPKYTSILSMKDTNEADNDGSLIVADYGKGKFVYTSLVFFRELPAGVPGAYRLFVNLIAKSQPKL
ncbi:MAG: LmbE family protein [Sphingobacteriales bacterium]|nr:LmbE family protein [Sphingobacteriales bacterium]